MRGHLLRLLQIPAIGQVNGDAGCPEGVAAYLGADPGFSRPPLDHPEGIVARERLCSQPAGLEIRRAEERLPFVLTDPRSRNIAIEVLLERVVHRHLVVLAALLVEPEPPAFP